MLRILCKFGWHKPSTIRYIRVDKQRGRHKYHRNYQVCDRCGKQLKPFKLYR